MNRQILTLLFILFFILGTRGWAVTTKCPDNQTSVGLQIRTAREKLRLSETTRDRVARDLENLKLSGRADPDMLQDYATYLQRVQDLVDENRRIVREMEALCAAEAKRSTAPGVQKEASGPDPVTSGEEIVDQVTLLDRRLRESLASFDEMLLKRINAIQAESAERMRGLAEQAAQAVNRSHQGGAGEGAAAKADKDGQQAKAPSQGREDSRQAQSPSQGEKAEGQAASPDTAQSDSSQGTTSRQNGGRASSGAGSSTDTGSPEARAYNRDDDDIVARQLREAAEQEKDPELKKRLWKEYEEYKKNTRP